MRARGRANSDEKDEHESADSQLDYHGAFNGAGVSIRERPINVGVALPVMWEKEAEEAMTAFTKKLAKVSPPSVPFLTLTRPQVVQPLSPSQKLLFLIYERWRMPIKAGPIPSGIAQKIM